PNMPDRDREREAYSPGQFLHPPNYNPKRPDTAIHLWCCRAVEALGLAGLVVNVEQVRHGNRVCGNRCPVEQVTRYQGAYSVTVGARIYQVQHSVGDTF